MIFGDLKDNKRTLLNVLAGEIVLNIQGGTCMNKLMGVTVCALSLASLFVPKVGIAQGKVKVEEHVKYLGYSNNIRLTNGTVELILTTDYGPRIMRYAFVGSGDNGNVFATLPGVTLKTVLGDWRIRGGTRFWHSPENDPRTYVPDNTPISYKILGPNSVELIEPTEAATGIQKSATITLAPTGTKVTVVEHLTNKGLWAVNLAGWTLSAMHPGGKAILPQEPFAGHGGSLLPARPVVLWTYTNMADHRWFWGKEFITLTQDPNDSAPQKLGILNKQGWAAYDRDGLLFIKRFGFHPAAQYPDYNCNNEAYTNNEFLEMESVGPLTELQPGATLTHTEHWWLFKNVELGHGEAGIAAAMHPIVQETAHQLNEK